MRPLGSDVRAEADLLRRCQGIPGIPSFVAWTQSGAARVLVLQRLDAQPLSQLEIGWLRLGAVLLALGGLVVRLAWRGISHNDLQPENILLDRAGRIHLVDFDQVSSGSFVLCLARSFLGLRLVGMPVKSTMWAALRERIQASLPSAAIFARRAANSSSIAPAPAQGKGASSWYRAPGP